jgi:hypothetical protein
MGLRLRLDRNPHLLHLLGAPEHVDGVDLLLLDDVAILVIIIADLLVLNVCQFKDLEKLKNYQ